MFWSGAGNSVEKNKEVSVTAEHHLHKDFSAPHPPPPRKRLEMSKTLRGKRAGIANPN